MAPEDRIAIEGGANAFCFIAEHKNGRPFEGPLLNLERETRFEPATFSLATRSSTTELLPRGFKFIPQIRGSWNVARGSWIGLRFKLSQGDSSVAARTAIIPGMASLSDALSRLGAILDSAARIAVAERARMHVESKPDDSLVTNADKAVERYLRGELPALAQKSTIWGEEEGYEPEGPGGLWLVDPIDGTSNYRFGQPLWGISVGLYRNGGVPEIGGIALPDLGETYLAELR